MHIRHIRNLATATVTFLVTDVEGSTQLWECYPDQAQAELYERSLMQAREPGISLLMASSLHKLEQVARHFGDYPKAASSLGESLRMNRELGNKQGIAECLTALAGVAAAQGHLEQVARLFSAADALLERIKMPLTPADRAQYEADLAVARTQVDGQAGETAWEAAWAEGRAMGLEQAIEYALAQTGTGN